MKIYRPILTNYKTQGFAENLACVKVDSAGAILFPVEVVTKRGEMCSTDYEDFYKTVGLSGHNGEDWMSYDGEPCYFPVDINGVTWYAKSEKDNNGGVGLDVISREKITLDKRTDYLKIRFWHLKSVEVSDDSEISFGQFIAKCDSTGASSGHHIHFSMKWCTKDGVALDKDNGYYGAVDFSPWFENKSTLEVLGVKARALSAMEAARSVITEVKILLKKFNA